MRLTNPESRAGKRMLGACLVASGVVAALALAAADDITTGSEPTLLGEWLVLAFAAVWFLAAGAWVRQQRASTRRHVAADAADGGGHRRPRSFRPGTSG